MTKSEVTISATNHGTRYYTKSLRFCDAPITS